MSGTAARLRQTGSLVETSVPQNLGLWADSLLSSPHSRVRLNLLDQLGPCGRRPIPVPVERKPVAGNGPFRRPYYSVVPQYPIVVQYTIVPSVRACACSKAKYAIVPIRSPPKPQLWAMHVKAGVALAWGQIQDRREARGIPGVGPNPGQTLSRAGLPAPWG